MPPFIYVLIFGLLARAGETRLPSERDQWIEVRTDHFTFFSNASQKQSLEIAQNLERFRALLAFIRPGGEIVQPLPTKVFVFKQSRAFAPYRMWRGTIERSLQGYFLRHPHGNYIAMNATPRQEEPEAVLFHEMFHAYARHNLIGIPLWLEEGLAEYHKTFRVLSNKLHLGVPIPWHVVLLRTHGTMPLKVLFEIDADSDEYREFEKKGMFYAQCWALVHYLLSGNEDLAPRFPALLDAFAAGSETEPALASALGLDLDQLERQLLGYVHGAHFPTLSLESGRLRFSDNADVRGLSHAEALSRLGELLAHCGPEAAEDARAHFLAALEIEPQQPEVFTGLAVLADGAGQTDEVERLAQIAVSMGAKEALPYYLGADSILRRSGDVASLEQARSLLQQAILLAPGFGELHFLLGQTFFKDPNRAAEGVSHFKKAMALLPDRGDIGINLARLYLNLEQWQEADELVSKLSQSHQDSKSAAELKELLERKRWVSEVNAALIAGDAAMVREIFDRGVEAGIDPTLLDRVSAELRNMENNVLVDSKEARYNRAVGLLNEGKDDEAREILLELDQELEDGALKRAVFILLRRLHQKP